MAKWWQWTRIQGGSSGPLTAALLCFQCLEPQMTSRTLKTAQLAALFILSYPQSMGSCMATVSRAPSLVALEVLLKLVQLPLGAIGHPMQSLADSLCQASAFHALTVK